MEGYQKCTPLGHWPAKPTPQTSPFLPPTSVPCLNDPCLSSRPNPPSRAMFHGDRISCTATSTCSAVEVLDSTIFSSDSELLIGSDWVWKESLIKLSRYEAALLHFRARRSRLLANRGRSEGKQALTIAMFISTLDHVAAPKSVSRGEFVLGKVHTKSQPSSTHMLGH